LTLATLFRKARSAWLAQVVTRRLPASERTATTAFLRLAHETVLGRPAAEPTLGQLLQLAEAGAPRRILVEFLLLSAFGEKLHALRCGLVRQLPPAEVIVDLGGASGLAPEGALLGMGYPHAPREITIIDLPAATRTAPGQTPDPAREPAQWTVYGATRVRYRHQSMTDLHGVEDASADLVWAGESLEHISLAEARQTLGEVWRILRPGGRFCLDTPNRALTRLQSPHTLIHPGHQVEYTAPQLRQLLVAAGFAEVTVQGLGPMPWSARLRVFLPGELRPTATLSDCPERCYLLYAQAVKPLISG